MLGLQRKRRQVCHEAALSPNRADISEMLAFHPNILFLPGPESQLSDLLPTMLKLDYAAVPLAQT